MASRLSFRQHIILLLFIDMFVLIFGGLSSNSFLGKFISSPFSIDLSSSSAFVLTIITIFVGISAIGVTNGFNFAGISGILASLFGKSSGKVLSTGTLLFVLTDYALIYNFIVGGAGNTWEGYWIRLIALILFFPIIVDAFFASIDWVRGVNL